MMTFDNCVPLGDGDQAETTEPQQTEAPRPTSGQDTEELQSKKDPRSASPTQKVMPKSSSPDPGGRDFNFLVFNQQVDEEEASGVEPHPAAEQQAVSAEHQVTQPQNVTKGLVCVLTVLTASSQETEDGNAAASPAPDEGVAAEVSVEARDDSQEHQENSPPAGKDAQHMVSCLQSSHLQMYNPMVLYLTLLLLLRRKRTRQIRCHQDPFKMSLCLDLFCLIQWTNGKYEQK